MLETLQVLGDNVSMRIISSGFHKRNFSTIDVTLCDDYSGLKITNEKNDYQILIKPENKIELKKLKEMVNRITIHDNIEEK